MPQDPEQQVGVSPYFGVLIIRNLKPLFRKLPGGATDPGAAGWWQPCAALRGPPSEKLYYKGVNTYRYYFGGSLL